MRLKDVLALPKSSDSLEMLKTFLNQQPSYHDYMAAFLHYIGILVLTQSYETLIKDAESVILKYDQPSLDTWMDQAYDMFIEALLHQDYLEKAHIYILKRKEKLTYADKHKVFLHEYTYLIKVNMPVDNFIKDILELPMPEKTYRFFTTKTVIRLNEDKKFEDAMYVLNKLETTFGSSELELKLPTLAGLNRYQEMLDILVPYQKQMSPLSLYYFILTYIGLKMYQKAINLEVEYEKLMDTDNPFQLSYFELLLRMYKTLNNTLSMKVYETKIQKYHSSVKKKLKTLEVKQPVILTLVEEKKPLATEQPKTLETYEKMISYLYKVSSLDTSLPFRDLLRLIGVHAQRFSSFTTFVLYIKHDKTLYFFKKDRLYDKKLKPHQLEHTMVEYIQDQHIEGYFDLHQFQLRKDIVTEHTYEGIHHMYGYMHQDIIFLSYYEEEDIVYASEDDMLRMMFIHIIQIYGFVRARSNYKDQAHIYQLLLKHPQHMMRIYSEGLSTYSIKAKESFDITDETSMDDFIKQLPVSMKAPYKEHILKLHSLNASEADFKFNIEDKVYQEYSYVRNEEDQPLIISIFNDITHFKTEQQDVYTQAHTDLMTQLPNVTAFQYAFKNIIKEKVTFLKIELSKHIHFLYGQKEYYQYFKEFAHLTKKICQSDEIFIIDHKHILVILPYNDIRSVTKMIRTYVDKVLSWMPKSIPQEPFMPILGVLRYPVVTNDQHVDVILSYLDIALNKASSQTYPFMHDFQFQDYEDDQKEQYILDHIHEAINNKQFSIGFHQIIHQTQNKVWMYESFAYIPHLDIDEKDIKRIAKKRKRIVEFDTAHLERVCMMLKEMYDVTGKYIKILVPIDKDTLLHHLSLETISNMLNQYKIPKHMIHLNVEGDFKASVYSVLFEDITRLGMDIHVSSLKTALYYPCVALHFDIKQPDLKMMTYLKTIKAFCKEHQMDFVIRNVLSKEIKALLLKDSLECIEGPIYKRLTQEALFLKVIQK